MLVNIGGICLGSVRSAGCTDWVADGVCESSDCLALARQTHSYSEAPTVTCCPGP